MHQLKAEVFKIMKWVMKAIAAKILSVAPGGEWIYEFLQENVTKSIRVSEGMVKQKADVGLSYMRRLVNHRTPEWLVGALYYEFGAGWHLTIPLLFYVLGVQRQNLTDIKRHVKPEILRDVVNTLQQLMPYIATSNPLGTPLRNLPRFDESQQLEEYLAQLGITYQAPVDARRTEFDDDTFDMITSTQVLLYPSEEDVEKILRESYRVLKKGGLFVISVHLFDQYSTFDGKISPYNYLKFSDFMWERLLNSDMTYFNRLRGQDYLTLFQQIGYNVKELDFVQPDEQDIELLRNLKINKKFSAYSLKELAIKGMLAILEK